MSAGNIALLRTEIKKNDLRKKLSESIIYAETTQLFAKQVTYEYVSEPWDLRQTLWSAAGLSGGPRVMLETAWLSVFEKETVIEWTCY